MIFTTQVDRPNERLSARALDNMLMMAHAGVTEIQTKLDGLKCDVGKANKGIISIKEKLTELVEALPKQLGLLRTGLLSMVETTLAPMLRECMNGELQPMREELGNLSNAMQSQVFSQFSYQSK